MKKHEYVKVETAGNPRCVGYYWIEAVITDITGASAYERAIDYWDGKDWEYHFKKHVTGYYLIPDNIDDL